MGAFAYADDVILLCPTKNSLLMLLEVATAFSEKYKIKFNASKSKLLLFDSKTKVTAGTVTIDFNNQQLVTSLHEKHLGNILGQDSGKESIKCITKDFYTKFNVMMLKFKCCTFDINILYHFVCHSMGDYYGIKAVSLWKVFIFPGESV